MNETHDPRRRSWLASANHPGAEFPIQNLPFAVLRRRDAGERFRPAVAIGDQALDLAALAASGVARLAALDVCGDGPLNALMASGPSAWSALRFLLSDLLREGSAHQDVVERSLIPLEAVEFAVPARIGDYTDFYTSIHHATNIGRLFRPDNPLLPNYRWLPIGYHGRSSSIGVSGQEFVRPSGQLMPAGAEQPLLAPCQRLDYELEVGVFIGQGNRLGQPVDLSAAENHIFGLCLLNDWSARDIQAWEYQPLGPFLAKSFATTISPWVVTMEALEPFRSPWSRAAGEPAALPYLASAGNDAAGAIDLRLEVALQTAQMRARGEAPVTLSRSNLTDAYWTVAQLVTHHTVSGCNLRPGDLFGTGTMSGAGAGSEGALIELTRGGAQPLKLPGGEARTFLEDGDTVILSGKCVRAGQVSIGFGEAVGTVLPAR